MMAFFMPKNRFEPVGQNENESENEELILFLTLFLILLSLLEIPNPIHLVIWRVGDLVS